MSTNRDAANRRARSNLRGKGRYLGQRGLRGRARSTEPGFYTFPGNSPGGSPGQGNLSGMQAITNFVANASYGELVRMRRALATDLGMKAFQGQRDYNKILGYPGSPVFNDYKAMYDRGGIAARIVNVPADDAWRHRPVIEDGGKTDTAFCNELDALEMRLHLYSAMHRADRLSGIGRFGILLIGVRGTGNLATPLMNRACSSQQDILYFRPLSEASVEVNSVGGDSSSPRFGLPITYGVKFDGGSSVDVHHSRVIHIAENLGDSLIYGTPRLKRPLNRLHDLVKLVGGSAEATWLLMRKGFLLTNQPGYAIPMDADSVDAREAEIEEFRHGLLRFLMLEGVQATELGSETVDPSPLFNVVVACLAAAANMPQRILVGSAQGELAAASVDLEQWAGTISSRQTNHVEPIILRPVIERLQNLGALPFADYKVKWPPLFELNELQQARVIATRASAVQRLGMQQGLQLPLSVPEQRQLLASFLEIDVSEVPEWPEQTPMPPVLQSALRDVFDIPLYTDDETTIHNEDLQCPLCFEFGATVYIDHGGLAVCDSCKQTFDPSIESA